MGDGKEQYIKIQKNETRGCEKKKTDVGGERKKKYTLSHLSSISLMTCVLIHPPAVCYSFFPYSFFQTANGNVKPTHTHRRKTPLENSLGSTLSSPLLSVVIQPFTSAPSLPFHYIKKITVLPPHFLSLPFYSHLLFHFNVRS